MVMPTHKACRIRRTEFFMEYRAHFLAQLRHELSLLVGRAKRKGLRPAVRLNGSSDVPWETIAPEIIGSFPQVKFYDYTKNVQRMHRFLARRQAGCGWPLNYYLTFSRSEDNEADCFRILELGGTVAVVFDRAPKTWYGARVIDGDRHDARFFDRPGVVIGLSAKGKARKDSSGFVVRERMA